MRPWHLGERGDTSFVTPGYQHVVWARECSSLSLPICTVEVPAGPHPGVMMKTQSTQHVDTANRSQMARVILTSRSLLADTPPAFRHLAGSGETAMVLNKLQPTRVHSILRFLFLVPERPFPLSRGMSEWESYCRNQMHWCPAPAAFSSRSETCAMLVGLLEVPPAAATSVRKKRIPVPSGPKLRGCLGRAPEMQTQEGTWSSREQK